MTNLVAALKSEIVRIAKKEVRTEILALKESVRQHRSDIAVLKRRVADLERHTATKRAGKLKDDATGTEVPSSEGLRFRPQGLASHRQRLGLSAQAMGRLLGVSGQSVASWETGRTVPRRSQLPAIAAVRKMGKREVAERLALKFLQ